VESGAKKTGRAKVGRTKAVVWAKGEKKGTADKPSAFDLSRPSDFMVFISNLINPQVAQARSMSSSLYVDLCIVT